MEFENIIEALQGNAELTNKTLVALKETEQGKQLLTITLMLTRLIELRK